ncbi:MAG: flagellar capping protein FliD [Ignavibacteria bacterium]|nr:MAG: flagellar capping protein FliD [Ignavibacteria bacterium]KAF0160175.1 MAG: flagellar capping protein FliD [Ignavibacteria bacterium]
MASDLLTTSGINKLVSNYIASESSKRLAPLNTRKTRYQDLDSAYSTISSKISSFTSILSALKGTGTSSAFADKSATSSNTNFVSVTANSTALTGSQSLRVNQLAKNDLVLSRDLTSSAASTDITAAGTHNFVITAGDGTGGAFTSTVSVTFEAADFTAGTISNQKVMEKIHTAVNSDKAVVTSNMLTGSSVSSGSFVIDLNGARTTISYSAGTYSSIIDNIITQVNAISGITAEKIVNGSNNQLKLTVADSSKYITISNDTSNLVAEMGIAVTKEKGASGLVSASTFSPVNTTSQFSFTAKQSGFDNRILSMTDSGTGRALTSIGLNLGATRPAFVQSTGIDTPGYVYATTALNSRFEFNGLSLERNFNTITDLLAGVTFNLKAVMQSTDSTVSLTVEGDTTKVKERVQSFVTKFNELYTYLKEKSTSTRTTRGLLLGDSTTDSILTNLRTVAAGTISGINSSEINSLSKLGITFTTNGGLTISDNSRLETAIKDNLSQVEAAFNSANGIANALFNRLNPYLGSDGHITKSKANFTSSIQYLSDSIKSQQTRIDKSAEILRNQYQKLQTQLATLLSNQRYFMPSS